MKILERQIADLNVTDYPFKPNDLNFRMLKTES